MTVRPPLAGGASFNFTWDAWDRLKSAARTGQTTVNYEYDALGRLRRRTQGSDVTYYYWVGLNKIAEGKGISARG